MTSPAMPQSSQEQGAERVITTPPTKRETWRGLRVMRATFRPLPTWPYPPQRKRYASFRVSYARTLKDLEYEIDQVKGREVIIGVVADERDIRLDGQMRADARIRGSGVELSFEIPDGRRLVFHSDVHYDWKDNLRAIALGLESLRAVQRYGITTGIGEQYAGFAQLTAGGPQRGKQLVDAAGGMRQALMRHHPDHGGNEADFVDVDAYRKQAGL